MNPKHEAAKAATSGRRVVQSISPETRGKNVARLLNRYSGESNDAPADIAYALADILHWCDTAPARDRMTFNELFGWAREHYDTEKA